MLERLSRLGAGAWASGLYTLVEERLGFHESGERLALASAPADCGAAARAGLALDPLAARCGRALVVGAGPDPGGWEPGGYDVVVAAGAGLERLAAHSRAPDVVVTDVDGGMAWAIPLLGVPVLLHFHADNHPRAAEAAARLRAYVATGQVPWGDCVLAPLGFADGDRAIALAVAMECDSIEAVGVDIHGPAPAKFEVSAAYARYFLAQAGYEVKPAPGGFTAQLKA